ncbi:MAG: tyrosine-type recombinase/integrase [Actinomycetota bacterium]|jgi:site-specific recombinase XerD|nr:tyrosine-type recombinase/integrase [Actinomycetota bacterium]
MAKTITYLSEVPVSGPLAPLVGEFKASLADAGYVVPVAREHLWLMAQVSRWMEDRGLSVGDLDDVRVEAFLADRRAAGRRTLCSARGLAPLLRLLRAHGLPGAAPPAGAVEELLAGFGRYLADERAVAPSTARLYTKRVRRFLARCAPDANLRAVSAGQVTAAVLAECETVSVGSAQYFVAALRSFLRFCYLERLTDTDLSAAALAVSGRRPSWLPKGMSRREVSALLGSCDRRTEAGRRDYAILLLLARLGLRAGEVAALRLEDIDWRSGELLVRGKGPRFDRLPLPVDVGEAVAAYLTRGRPRTSCREVFVSVAAPIGALGNMAISDVVRRSCRRAGVEPIGAHRLRHALAVDLVAAGAALPEIGQLLRHRSASATRIYARVDVELLRSVAQPWPVGGRR